MALFADREQKDLPRSLRHDLHLLLPADPGRERMLEYVHLFDHRARGVGGGRIDLWNSREIFITRPVPIDPETGYAAGVPADMTVAYFAHVRDRSFSAYSSICTKSELREISIRLMNGLAIRMGGMVWPQAPVLEEPLRATIYTSHEITAAQVYGIASRYSPQLAPYHDPSLASINVSTWRTPDRQFEAQHWPGGATAVLLPHEPRSIGDDLYFLRAEKLYAVRLELLSPANVADPGIARLLGRCALEIAAATGGVCVDQLGFRVQHPDEIVFG